MTDPGLDAQQRRANDRLWRRGRDLVSAYATRLLRPVEVLLLVRYREALSARTLELGSGAGRLTGYLIEVGSDVHGIDISPAMIAYCRNRYPRGTFTRADLRAVDTIPGGPFDAVFAPFNVLDVLTDGERGALLDRIGAVLADDGLFIMSAHNRGYAPRLADPFALRGKTLRRIVETAIHLPTWYRNRKRVLPFEHEEPGYAVLNDVSHDFKALHYYISRDAQEQQLEAHGFAFIECLDLDGREVAPGALAEDCPELHYVARRARTT